MRVKPGACRLVRRRPAAPRVEPRRGQLSDEAVRGLAFRRKRRCVCRSGSSVNTRETMSDWAAYRQHQTAKDSTVGPDKPLGRRGAEWCAFYHYYQNDYNTSSCTNGGLSASSCAGTLNALSAMIDCRPAKRLDLYAGVLWSQVTGGLASGYLYHQNFGPTAGLRFEFESPSFQRRTSRTTVRNQKALIASSASRSFEGGRVEMQRRKSVFAFIGCSQGSRPW